MSQVNPMEINGFSTIAMKGNNCIAIATTSNFGIQLRSIGKKFDCVKNISGNIHLSLTGLASDIITVTDKLMGKVQEYELIEGKLSS